MTNDGIEIYPHVEARGLLYLNFRKGKVALTAGKYIGLIPLTPSISIDVRPKMPIGNLARLLDGSRIIIDQIAGVERGYLIADYSSNSVLAFLLSNLINATEPLQAFGLHKAYTQVSSTSSSPQGRIQLSGTLQECWSRGLRHKVRTESFRQTSDIPVNRVIKAAFKHVLTGLSQIGGDKILIHRGNLIFTDFPDQISSLKADDFQQVHDVLIGRRMPDSRHYYYKALEIAILTLSGRSISLERAGHDLSLSAYIVDLESAFEDYLRHVLKKLCHESITVRDGNKEGKRPLFDGKKDPPAQPDIVLRRPSSVKCIIVEVKYKDRPSREDINQVATYCLAYRTDRAILVHQSRPGTKGGLKSLGVINGIRIDSYGFDMSQINLEVEEHAFAECMNMALVEDSTT